MVGLVEGQELHPVYIGYLDPIYSQEQDESSMFKIQ